MFKKIGRMIVLGIRKMHVVFSNWEILLAPKYILASPKLYGKSFTHRSVRRGTIKHTEEASQF